MHKDLNVTCSDFAFGGRLAGTDHLRDRDADSLSGGQKQLVWIAMAIAQARSCPCWTSRRRSSILATNWK